MLLSVLKVWTQLSEKKKHKGWHLQAAAASIIPRPIINTFVTTAAKDAFRTNQKQKRAAAFLCPLTLQSKSGPTCDDFFASFPSFETLISSMVL